MADALSRVPSSELVLMEISAISSDLMTQIQTSWETDVKLQGLIHQLQQWSNRHSPYIWSQNQLVKNG